MKIALLNIFAFFTIIFILIFGWQALNTQRVYFEQYIHFFTSDRPRCLHQVTFIGSSTTTFEAEEGVKIFIDGEEVKIKPCLKPATATKKILVPAGGSIPVTLQEIRTQGKASWYDYQLKGYPNYSKENYTAASRDYPRGTKLRVCRYGTSCYEGFCVSGKWQFPDKQGNFKEKCVDVRVNDYVENPDVIIDLSSVAFKALAPLSRGIIDVEITELK